MSIFKRNPRQTMCGITATDNSVVQQARGNINNAYISFTTLESDIIFGNKIINADFSDISGLLKSIAEYYSLQNSIPKSNYAPEFDLQELIDRRELFEIIQGKLESESYPIYICSFGGIGKTILAKAFCNSAYVQKYDYIFWVDSGSGSLDIREDIMNCPVFQFNREENLEEATDSQFLRFINRTRIIGNNILMVIDNIDTLEKFRSIENKYSVPSLKWKVLVTSRIIGDTLATKNRTIQLETLREDYCIKLFLSIYCICSEVDRLNDLFRLLNYNTLLISLSAQISKKQNVFPSELIKLISSDGLLAIGTEQTITSLMNFSALTQLEILILCYFSILPERPFLHSDLIQWMTIDKKINEGQLNSVLDDLTQVGWLNISTDKSGEKRAFSCHNFIRTAVKANLLFDKTTVIPLLEKMAIFMKVEEDGGEYTHLIKYLDCAEYLLSYFGFEVNVRVYEFLRNYSRLLNVFKVDVERAFIIAQFLRNNYSQFFPYNQDTISWKREWLKIEDLYGVSLANSGNIKDKYNTGEKLRSNIFSFASSFLSHNDIDFVRAERRLATSKGDNSKAAEAAGDLKIIREKIEDIMLLIIDDRLRREWIYLYVNTLASLGIQLNRLSRKAKNCEKKKAFLMSAVDVRQRYLDIAKEVYGEQSSILCRPFNDLGMTYIFLSDLIPESKDQFLELAKKYLVSAYEKKVRVFGMESLTVALAQVNLSSLLERIDELKLSYEMAKKALETMINVYSDGQNHGSRELMRAYVRIAEVCVHLNRKYPNTDYIDEALVYADEAIKIVDFLFEGDITKDDYKMCIECITKVKLSMPNLD